MDLIVYALCKNMMKGMGAFKGANCTIEKIEPFEDVDPNTGRAISGQEVTFKWKDLNNVDHRKTTRILNGTTPLMYMGVPQLEATTVARGDKFNVIASKFNRPPRDGDPFFSYMINSKQGKIYLYAVAAEYDETLGQAVIDQYQKIAATGLKALVANDAIAQDITQDDVFELPLSIFSRAPDGEAEECLIFDRYGHYRQCSVKQKDDTTLTITPTGSPVDINIGKVRYLHTQATAADTWTVQFNLSFKYPDILVLDEDDNELYPEVEYYSDNLLYLKFSEPVKGIAYISK